MKPAWPQRLNGCRCVNTASYLMTPTTKLKCAANGGECLKEKNKAQLLTQPWAHSNNLKATQIFFFFYIFLPGRLESVSHMLWLINSRGNCSQQSVSDRQHMSWIFWRGDFTRTPLLFMHKILVCIFWPILQINIFFKPDDQPVEGSVQFKCCFYICQNPFSEQATPTTPTFTPL